MERTGNLRLPFTTTFDRMSLSVFLVAVVAFMGTMHVTSGAGAWILGVSQVFKTPAQPGAVFSALLLHSGPWILAVIGGGLYYAAPFADKAYLWALAGGFTAGLAVIAGVALWATRRARLLEPPIPLTPERLLAIRRRFSWTNSLVIGFAMFAWFTFPEFGHRPGLMIVTFFVSLAGGWTWSWFMWQWYGASLKAQEQARQKHQREHAV